MCRAARGDLRVTTITNTDTGGTLDSASNSTPATEVAVLGGGCFWCLEAVFVELRGVERVRSGYAGGTLPNPTYESVCSGRSGHAEVVEVAFDPAELSFDELLTVFFTIHDPTTRDRQGNDVGSQYRSVIFAQSPAQLAAAQAVIARLEKAGLWPARFVTELAGPATFYPAESYHQRYFERNPQVPYCAVVVAPKVAKFRRRFTERLRTPSPKP